MIHKRASSGCLLVLLAASAAAQISCHDERRSDSPPRLYRAEGDKMVTAEGQVLLLRGINISGLAKTTEGHLHDLDEEKVERLLSDGINSVRLLVFWNAIAPEGPGLFDQGYLAAFADQVRMLTDAGLYVVVDMHQDLWGEPFLSHGAPGWACPEETTAGYEPKSPWWLNYVSRQVRGCFDLFWSDPDLRAEYIEAWVETARVVCPFSKVLGFDLMNEPYPGTALFDSAFDNEVLMPFYREVMEEIEKACPGRLYFLEPSAGFTIGIGDDLEIPDEIRDRVVWSGHFYPATVHEPDGDGYDGDAEALENEVFRKIAHQLEKGVPVWVGEYGGVTTVPNFQAYMEDLHAIFARYNVSSALWDFQQDDGGFAFLDVTGARKQVFDPVFGTPTPTELPAGPILSYDWAASLVRAELGCVQNRRILMLLPSAECSCEVEPQGSLTPFSLVSGFSESLCLGDDEIVLRCFCP